MSGSPWFLSTLLREHIKGSAKSQSHEGSGRFSGHSRERVSSHCYLAGSWTTAKYGEVLMPLLRHFDSSTEWFQTKAISG